MAQKIYANMELYGKIEKNEHLVNKAYVDKEIANEISKKFKAPVRVVACETTSGNLSGTYTEANKTLTLNPGALEIDGVDIIKDDRILLAAQADAKQNGIYVCATAGAAEIEEVLYTQDDEDAGTIPAGSNVGDVKVAGVAAIAAVLVRAEDYDESSKIQINALIPVSQGSREADTVWQLINDTSVELDTDDIAFAKIKGEGGVIVKNFTITGDGTENSWEFAHNILSTNVDVIITDADGSICYFDVTVVDDKKVKVDADNAPEAGETFSVTIKG